MICYITNTESPGACKMENRREFIKKAGLAGAAFPIINSSGFLKDTKKVSSQICYFTKHLQWLDFDDLGLVLRDAGFDGVDLTVFDFEPAANQGLGENLVPQKELVVVLQGVKRVGQGTGQKILDVR